MQILGLSDSTPKPENRLKALFWPSIRHETDVDHITRQGFWICFAIACLTLILGVVQGPAYFIGGICDALFFFLSGVGIRMRSVFAAACALCVYCLSTVVVGPGNGVRLLFIALLVANLRGTWLSARWRASQSEPPPVPLDQTLTDKLADRFPIAVWPVGRYFYYVVATMELVLLAVGILASMGKIKPGA